MSLVSYPECSKEISDKAIRCPHCGYPISNIEMNIGIVNTNLVCPTFPADLSIGKQLVGVSYKTMVDGIYESNNGADSIIGTGKVKVLLYTQGLEIRRSFFETPYIQINYTQIISVSELRGSQVKDKSVVGRAVVGGVILGPLGALVGGMSGIGDKYVKSYILIINYWDVTTRVPKTISIACPITSLRFIERIYEERNNYINTIAPDNETYAIAPMKPTESEKRMVKIFRDSKKHPEYKNKTDEELLQIIREAKKNSACFVATVVYNDNDCIEVNKLRIWRDTRLKKSAVGRLFIKLYYQYGEKLSLIIKPHQRICKIIRSVLNLFIKFL